MEEVVVSGVGCVTPIGIGIDAFSAGLRAGVSGLRALTAFDAAPFRCRVAAGIEAFRPEDFMALRDARCLPRCTQLAVAAGRLAVEHAALSCAPEAVGVVMGSSIGPAAYCFEQFATFIERGARRVHPQFPAFAHNGAIAAECSIQLGLKGPSLTVSSACVSGADAVGIARMMIRSGAVDVVLAGAADAPLTPMLFAAFDRLGLMPTKFNANPASAMRPFDADREGFVLGEGAAVLVLESETHARRRGARVLGRISGYAATSDAFGHFAQPHSTEDAVRAIHLALADAALERGAIGYVNAHGSATLQNDVFETRVLHAALGKGAVLVPVSSSKSMLGHAMGAAPTMGLVAILVGMRDGFVPPTINLVSPDERCDLDYVPGVSRAVRFESALSLSFGFGSRNAAVIVSRAE